MPKLTIVNRNGDERTVDAPIGLSVMETIRSHGYDELLALCGGCCSCATCHVYVDTASTCGLPVMSEDENDLLGGSSHRTDASRLSCQIVVDAATDGLKVTIAPED